MWFTDPRNGITDHHEGTPAESEIGADLVFRVDGATGELTSVADDFVRPSWFDGIRLDETGRVCAASSDGLHCYHPDGTLPGRPLLPEFLSNLVFGGGRRNSAFLTTSAGDAWSIRVGFAGARYPG